MWTPASPPPPATSSTSVGALTRGPSRSLRRKPLRWGDATNESTCVCSLRSRWYKSHISYEQISNCSLFLRWGRGRSSTPGFWTSWRQRGSVASPLTSRSGSLKPASTTWRSSMLRVTGTSSRTWSLGPHRCVTWGCSAILCALHAVRCEVLCTPVSLRNKDRWQSVYPASYSTTHRGHEGKMKKS